MPPVLPHLVLRQIEHGSADYLTAVSLRRRILRTPLGLDFTAEQLAAEAGDCLLAAFSDGVVAGTLVLTPGQGAMKLRQMAVAPEACGQGIGSGLVAFAEDWARDKGFRQIVLHARVSAQGFYEKAGYRPEGDVFIEVTIPHIAMAKTL